MVRILKEKECYELLETNYISHLAYLFNNKPFVAPITYYFDKQRNVIICYSDEGHKITAMRKMKKVAMEVSEISTVNHWNSIVVHGTYEELHGSIAKAYLHDFSLGIKDLIITKEQRKLDFINQFSSEIHKGDFPIVFLIRIDEITGRMRRN